MKDYQLFKQCLECRECLCKHPFKYLPTPWQGQISSKTKLLFIGVNPSPRDAGEYSDLNHSAQQGYSVRIEDYNKYQDKEKLCETLYSALADAENRQRIHKTLKVSKFFMDRVREVSRVLLNKENIDDFNDFVTTELIHCQTAKEDEIKDLLSMAQICFKLHTQHYLRLFDNLDWIICLGRENRFFFNHPETVKIINDIFKSDLKTRKTKDMAKAFDIIRLTDKTRMIFLPFFGWRAWHNEELIKLKEVLKAGT